MPTFSLGPFNIPLNDISDSCLRSCCAIELSGVFYQQLPVRVGVLGIGLGEVLSALPLEGNPRYLLLKHSLDLKCLYPLAP